MFYYKLFYPNVLYDTYPIRLLMIINESSKIIVVGWILFHLPCTHGR